MTDFNSVEVLELMGTIATGYEIMIVTRGEKGGEGNTATVRRGKARRTCTGSWTARKEVVRGG